MARYIGNNEYDKKLMLEKIGIQSTDELFKDVSKDIRLKDELNIPDAVPEYELLKKMRKMAEKNENTDDNICFLGAGAYDHFIPTNIDQLLLRQEFYTSYTPYQPEISQGTLRSIFEFQTMICELTGMDVANASMYDGATAMTEAALLAWASGKRNEILIAKSVNPENREVLKTYAKYRNIKITEVNYNNGLIDISDLKNKLNDDVSALILQSPNFFGVVENIKEVEGIIHDNKSLLIVCADPISLAVLKSPGELGADIVVGEAQSLGANLSFGGPYIGFFAAKEKWMRKIPGRIVGQTVDKEGKRGFVLTLQTREQHIRREKATSNICSNQGLLALGATMYMSFLGKEGFKKVSELSFQKAHYAYNELIKTGLFEEVFKSPFHKEFVVKSKKPIKELNEKLMKDGIIGGYDLSRDYEELKDCYLIAVTEKRTKEDIDLLVRKVSE